MSQAQLDSAGGGCKGQQPPHNVVVYMAGEGGPQNGGPGNGGVQGVPRALITPNPVKPTNPHMANGFRSSNPLHQKQQLYNGADGAANCYPTSQSLQYLPGGNYITTVTVQQSQQQQTPQTQQVVQSQQPQQNQAGFLQANNNTGKNSAMVNVNTSNQMMSNQVNNSNSNNLVVARPRTSSRCDSVRSETAESSCSSLSSDSQNEQQQHNQNQLDNAQQQQPYQQYMNNYANYMASQSSGANNGGMHPGMYNQNQNTSIVQSFQQVNAVQHVQMQGGQLQIMHQYNYVQQGQQQQSCMMQTPNPGATQGQNVPTAPNPNMNLSAASGPNMNMHGQANMNVMTNMNMTQQQLQQAGTNMPAGVQFHGSHGPNMMAQTGGHPNAHMNMGQYPIQQQQQFMGEPQSVQAQAAVQGANANSPFAKMNQVGANSPMFPDIVVVPFGWRRLVNNGQVIYKSPSGSELRNTLEVGEYLTTEGTCKCGLQCPLRVENTFNFDPKVPSRPTLLPELESGDMTKLCNHRRKLAIAFTHHLHNNAKKEDGRKKRKRKAASETTDSGRGNSGSTQLPSRRGGGGGVGTTSGQLPLGAIASPGQMPPGATASPVQMPPGAAASPGQMHRGPNPASQMSCGANGPHNMQQMPRLPSPAQMTRVPTPTQFNAQQQQQQAQQHHPQQHPNCFPQQQGWGMMNGMPSAMGNGNSYNNMGGTMTNPQGCNSNYQQQQQPPHPPHPASQTCPPTSHNCCNSPHQMYPGNMNMNPMTGGPNMVPPIRPNMGPGSGFGDMIRPNMCRPMDPSMFRNQSQAAAAAAALQQQQQQASPQLQQQQSSQQQQSQFPHQSPQAMMGPGPHMMQGMRGVTPHPNMMNNNMMCRMPGPGMMPPRVLPPGAMPAPQAAGERPSVPPQPFWEEGEKRRKTGGRAKKRFKGANAVERVSPCPNIDVRNFNGDHSRPTVSGQGGPGPPSSGPSFMDDPSGYLAQQTALLNNTMAGGGMGQFSPQAPGISPRPPVPPQHSQTAMAGPGAAGTTLGMNQQQQLSQQQMQNQHMQMQSQQHQLTQQQLQSHHPQLQAHHQQPQLHPHQQQLHQQQLQSHHQQQQMHLSQQQHHLSQHQHLLQQQQQQHQSQQQQQSQQQSQQHQSQVQPPTQQQQQQQQPLQHQHHQPQQHQPQPQQQQKSQAQQQQQSQPQQQHQSQPQQQHQSQPHQQQLSQPQQQHQSQPQQQHQSQTPSQQQHQSQTPSQQQHQPQNQPQQTQQQPPQLQQPHQNSSPQTSISPVVSSHAARSTPMSTSPTVVPLPSNVPLPARVSKAATHTTNTVMTTPTILPTPSTHPSVTGTCSQTFSTPSISNTQTPSQNDTKNIKTPPLSRNSHQQNEGSRQLQSPKKEGDGTAPISSIAKVESSGLIHTTTVTYTSSSTLTTNTKIANSLPIISQAGSLNLKGKLSYGQCKIEEEQKSIKIKTEPIASLGNFKTSPIPSLQTDNKGSISPNMLGHSLKEQIKTEPWCKDTGSINGNLHNGENSTEQLSPSRSSSNGSAGLLSNKPLTPGPPGMSTESVGGITQSPLEMVQSIVSSIPVPSSLSSIRPGLPQSIPQPNVIASSQPQLPQQQQQQTSVPMSVSPGMYSVPISTNVTAVYGGGVTSSGMVRGAGPVLVGGPPAQSGVFVTSGNGCNGPANMVVVSSPFTNKGGATGVAVTSGMAGVVGMQAAAMPQMQVQQHMQPIQQHIQPQLQPQLQQQLQQFQPVQPVVQLVNTFATMQAPVIIQNGGNIIQSSTGILHSPGGMIAGPSSLTQGTIVTGQQLVSTPATLAVESPQHHQQQNQVGQPQSSPHLQVAQVVTTGLTGDTIEDSRRSNASTPLAASSTPSTPHSTPGSTPGSDTPSSGGSSGGRKRKRRRNTSTPQGSAASSQSSPQQQQGLVPAIIMGNKVQPHMVMNGPHMAQVAPYGSMGTMTAAGQMAQVATGAGQVGGGQMLQAATAQGTGAINVVQMVGNTLPNLPVQVHNPPAILVGSAPPQGVVINQLADGTFISTDPNTGMSYPVQLQLSGGHIVGVTPTGNATGGMVGPLPHGAAGGGMPAMVAVRPPATHTTAVVNGPKVVNISPSAASAHIAGAGVHVLPVTAATAYPAPGTNVSPGQATMCVNQASVPPVVVTSEYAGGQPVVMGGSACSSNTTVVQHKTTIVQQRTTLVATQGSAEVSTQTPGGLGESDVTSSDCVGVVAPASPSHQSAEVTTTRHDEDSTPPSDHPPPLAPHSPEKIKRAIPEEPHSASTSEEAVTCGHGLVWGPHRGHHYWPAQVLHQAGGECVIQWYGDHRVDTVKHSVLSMFPILPPRVPNRRSVRGQNALDKAIVEATRDQPYLLQQIQQNQILLQQQQQQQHQQQQQQNIGVPILDASGYAVSVQFGGQGTGHPCKMLDIQATPQPPLDPRHIILPQINPMMSEDGRKKTTSRIKSLSLPQAASLLSGQSSQSSLGCLVQPPVQPLRKRKRRNR